MTTQPDERADLVEELSKTLMVDIVNIVNSRGVLSVDLFADFILERQAKLIDEVQKAVQEECRGGINVDGIVREQKLMEENAKLRELVKDGISYAEDQQIMSVSDKKWVASARVMMEGRT